MKVLVIAAGGWHLGYVGCYGNDWMETPALDALAAESVVFDQHYSDWPDAAGARHAWATGLYRFASPASSELYPEGSADLIRLLRGAGVHTFLVRDARRPLPAEFARGWDHVAFVPAGQEELPLDQTLAAVSGALDQLAPLEHWLLWLELSPLLPPWELPEHFRDRYFEEGLEEDEDDVEAATEDQPLTPLTRPAFGLLQKGDNTTFLRLQRTYAGAVSYLDAGLGRLRTELQGRGLAEQMWLLVTSDRGAALGEHELVGDFRPWLHDELIHLPLIMRLPHAAEAGRRIPALTQSVDLLPTLLDVFGVPEAPVHGRSLLPLARGQVQKIRPYACSGLQIGPAVEWALRTPEWSFLLPLSTEPGNPPRGRQLYAKPDDRWEVNNLVQHHLDLVDRLEQVLRGFVEATLQPGPLQPTELGAVEAEAVASQRSVP